MDFDVKKFAKRLKEIRKAKGFKQETLCSKINMEPSNYSPFENGKGTPNVSKLYKIMVNLNVTPDELFEYEHQTNEKNLDAMNLKIYHNLSFKKKKALYKILRSLEDLC